THTIPEVTLYEFVRDYFDDGIDPVSPMLKKGEKSIVNDGIALFKDDQYMAKVPTEKALIFAFLRGNFKRGQISLDMNTGEEEHEKVMLSNINSKRKVRLTAIDVNSEYFKVEMNVRINGSVLEYDG